jgi:hypothetical protein
MESMKTALRLRTEFAKYSPRVLQDSTDNGCDCAEVLFDGGGEKLHVSVTVNAADDVCGVWLGGVCVSEETPIDKISELLGCIFEDKIAVVSKYRSRMRFEAKDPYFEKVCVISEDEFFDEYVNNLRKPKGWLYRLWNGNGVYVISKYSGREIIDIKKS